VTATYCWDATLLIHAERADRLDTLGTYLPRARHVVCDVVAERELRGMQRPDWLELVAMDDLELLDAMVRWQDVVGTVGAKNAGEAAVLAWAEVAGAVAVIDDRSARRAAAASRVQVHGSLWVLTEGVRSGASTPPVTGSFCDALLDTGIRWPFRRGGFETWARTERLLP